MASMNRPYVVILANGLNGLGAVRSAKYAGLKTYTVLTDSFDLCAYSRLNEYRCFLPQTLQNPRDWIKLGQKWGRVKRAPFSDDFLSNS